MENETRYVFKDDYVTIREDCCKINLYEYNNDSELVFDVVYCDEVITLLENLKNYMHDRNVYYVDLGTYEGENEDGEYTGEYYWNDDYVMDCKDINPYFSPDDCFYGNCIYRSDIQYILEALSEYSILTSIDRLDKLTLKSILRLKRKLVK